VIPLKTQKAENQLINSFMQLHENAKSGWQDLNLRPHAPQACIFTFHILTFGILLTVYQCFMFFIFSF